MNQTKLLILASGGGTRNSMFTYDGALPKCLTSVGDKTVLEAIIDSYKSLVNQVVIACQTRHSQAINDILTFRGYKDYEVVSYEQQNTAFQSLQTALNMIEGFDTDNWYINWSDVFVDKMPVTKTTTIFVDTKHQHRNLAYHDNGTHVVSTDNMRGNIPGIFFVTGDTLYSVVTEPGDPDFDKNLVAFEPNVCYKELSDVKDIGDYVKYSKYMQSIKSDNVCRYFNELEVEKQTVLKRPKTQKGIELHEIELAYYRRYSKEATAFARLLGYDRATKTMTLERINGQTCQSYVDSKSKLSDNKLSTVNKLVKAFKTAVATIHNIPLGNVLDTEQDIEAAIIKEFETMISTRVEPCKHLIDTVIASNHIKTIEGMPISNYQDMMFAVHNWLEKQLHAGSFDISITHGDPNTDNTMIDRKGDIRFVDPRGYFGNLKTLGLGVRQYDLAKFVYGFSGYSKLNRAEFLATRIVDGDLQVFVGPKELENITDVSIFDIDVDKNIKILVGIIWVKLTSYIINDPMKSVAAYLYGNALLTKLLDIQPIQ